MDDKRAEDFSRISGVPVEAIQQADREQREYEANLSDEVVTLMQQMKDDILKGFDRHTAGEITWAALWAETVCEVAVAAAALKDSLPSIILVESAKIARESEIQSYAMSMLDQISAAIKAIDLNEQAERN